MPRWISNYTLTARIFLRVAIIFRLPGLYSKKQPALAENPSTKAGCSLISFISFYAISVVLSN